MNPQDTSEINSRKKKSSSTSNLCICDHKLEGRHKRLLASVLECPQLKTEHPKDRLSVDNKMSFSFMLVKEMIFKRTIFWQNEANHTPLQNPIDAPL